MIKKVVLTPEQCGQLVPHWFELYDPKISRLSKLSMKKSRFDKSKQVMATPPIIVVDDEGYIVNGKHRACIANDRGYFLDVCIVRTSKDLKFHTPREAFGSMGLHEILHSFDYRGQYVGHCQRMGVNTVADLVRKYLH